MNIRWRWRCSSMSVRPLAVGMLIGVAAGMALPRPFEPAHAAQAAGQDQGAPAVDPALVDPAASAGQTAGEPLPPISIQTFDGPAAMVINFIRSGSANGFESFTTSLVRGLAASEDAERQAQAAGWKMYRVSEPGPNNNAVYVWLFDPVVNDANYAVPQLLNELFPADVQQLYETYNQSFGVGQMPLTLEPVELVADPR